MLRCWCYCDRHSWYKDTEEQRENQDQAAVVELDSNPLTFAPRPYLVTTLSDDLINFVT